MTLCSLRIFVPTRLHKMTLEDHLTWTFQGIVLRKQVLSPHKTVLVSQLPALYLFLLIYYLCLAIAEQYPARNDLRITEQTFFFNFKRVKLLNELWNLTVDTHVYCTHFIIDRSINV
jgi:hypothetical protein